MGIKTRFIKNLFQMLSFAACSLLLIIPIFCIGLVSNFQEKETNKEIFIIITSLIILYFLIGFYWIFQTVVIDKDGIALYFLNKKIKYFKWENIDRIKKRNVMRNNCYTIFFKNNEKPFNVDYRKSIKKAILFYSPESLKEKEEF